MPRIGREVLEYWVCGLAVALVTGLGRAAHINSTTAALVFLLVVLGTATFSGLVKATITSLAAVLAFNYYFLPPIGTLTIQDPQNWVAFAVFFITAITASQLSGRAQGKAREAGVQRLETERLYELSRAILVDESPSRTESRALAHLVRIFDLKQAQFLAAGEAASSFPIEPEWIERAQMQTSPLRQGDWLLVPVQLGGKYAGTLALQPQRSEQLTDAVAGSIANLLAIGLERHVSLERVGAAEAARRSDELRTALLDGLAHDLKTPLTVIKTSASVLQDRQDRMDGTAREMVGIIQQQVDRLQDTVGEAIETGRVEAGKFALGKVPCSIARLISGMAQQRGEWAARLRISEVAEDVFIQADPDLLRMALRQVIDNAIRYSPDDQPVEIDLETDASSIAIRVRDFGSGVPEADRPHIFDKFYQGAAGKQIAGGSGLGLAVTKRVVEAHGGTIALESLKDGSAFVIRMERERV